MPKGMPLLAVSRACFLPVTQLSAREQGTAVRPGFPLLSHPWPGLDGPCLCLRPPMRSQDHPGSVDLWASTGVASSPGQCAPPCLLLPAACLRTESAAAPPGSDSRRGQDAVIDPLPVHIAAERHDRVPWVYGCVAGFLRLRVLPTTANAPWAGSIPRASTLPSAGGPGS